MKKINNFTLIISWIGSIIIAWIGGNILWFFLQIPFGYDFTERALAGMAFFGVISIASSYWRDLENITIPTHHILASAHDYIDINPDYRIREIVVFGLRIAFAIYFCVYWFNQGSIWSNESATIQIVSNIFLVLLELGVLLLINAAITVYVIVVEPWRSFVVRNGKLFNSKRTVFYLSGVRVFTLVPLSLLWYWFCTPILEVKIPSTLSFVTIVLLISGMNIYYRRH